MIENNDLLFVRSNGNKELIGRCLLFKNVTEKISFSGFTIRARLNQNKIYPDFAAILSRSELTRAQFMKLGGGTNISNLSQAILNSIKIALPPLAEQKRIAEILSTWNRAIDVVEGLIENSQAQKKNLMQQLLTGKKRLPGFEGEWKLTKYGSAIEVVTRNVDWSDDQIYNLISVRRRSGGAFHRESLVGRDILTKSMRVTRAGDFLISKMQILHGASTITPDELDGYHISGSYISFVSKSADFDIRFLGWLSQTSKFYHQTYISSYGVHIEKMTFILKDFLKKNSLFPPTKKEQVAIVERLEMADKSIRLFQEELSHLKSEKTALMQQLLTGKRRVKIDKEAAA